MALEELAPRNSRDKTAMRIEKNITMIHTNVTPFSREARRTKTAVSLFSKSSLACGIQVAPRMRTYILKYKRENYKERKNDLLRIKTIKLQQHQYTYLHSSLDEDILFKSTVCRQFLAYPAKSRTEKSFLSERHHAPD